jgi:hypothetical protein
MRRHRSRSVGQALVEFTLVAPMFFLLLLAIMEAGRFIFYYEMLSSATREGARYAIVHGARAIDLCPSGPNPPWEGSNVCDPDGDNVKEAVRDAAIDLPGTSDLVFEEPMWETNNARGEKVRVAVSFAYPPLIPVIPDITVSAESSLVINN